MGRSIVFDLDGTLVDTLPDLTASLNRIVPASRVQPFATADVAAMIGDGMQALLTRALAARGRPYDAALFARFEADYLANVAVASAPYPGTAATLARLEAGGWRMAVATNKPEQPARELLRTLGLERFFKAIAGADSVPARKPDPRHALAALGAAGGEPAHAAMLGDHANDVRAARAAGLMPLFALWGYGRSEMADGAATVSTISVLPDLLEKLIQPETAPLA